jgi:hypothetical protein
MGRGGRKDRGQDSQCCKTFASMVRRIRDRESPGKARASRFVQALSQWIRHMDFGTCWLSFREKTAKHCATVEIHSWRAWFGRAAWSKATKSTSSSVKQSGPRLLARFGGRSLRRICMASNVVKISSLQYRTSTCRYVGESPCWRKAENGAQAAWS